MLINFYDLPSETYVDQMGMLGALFYISIAQTTSNVFYALLTLHLERSLLMREFHEGLYGLFAYYMSLFFIELPLMIMVPLVISFIMYFGIGLTISVGGFFKFFFTLFNVNCCAQAYGILISSLFTRAETAL